MQYRKAEIADFLSIAALDREAWKGYPNGELLPDGEHTWRHWVEHAIAFVAEKEGRIVGVAHAYPCANGGYCVHKIMVAKELRGQGVGTKLTQMLLEETDARGVATFLTVFPGNAGALKIYRALGFEGDEVIQGYYRPDEHRYELRRKPQGNLRRVS